MVDFVLESIPANFSETSKKKHPWCFLALLLSLPLSESPCWWRGREGIHSVTWGLKEELDTLIKSVEREILLKVNSEHPREWLRGVELTAVWCCSSNARPFLPSPSQALPRVSTGTQHLNFWATSVERKLFTNRKDELFSELIWLPEGERKGQWPGGGSPPPLSRTKLLYHLWICPGSSRRSAFNSDTSVYNLKIGTLNMLHCTCKTESLMSCQSLKVFLDPLYIYLSSPYFLFFPFLAKDPQEGLYLFTEFTLPGLSTFWNTSFFELLFCT